MTESSTHTQVVRLDGTPIENIVVALDGSRYAERALGPAHRIAASLGVDVGLVRVIQKEAELAEASEYHRRVLAGDSAIHWHEIVTAEDPTPAILAITEERHGLLCMAAHGHSRLYDATIGSTASELTRDTTEPIVVIGSGYDSGLRHPIGRIVVPVNDTPTSEAIIPWASSWASAVNAPLHLMTIAERVPDPITPGDLPQRRFGPTGIPEDYINALVTRSMRPGLEISGEVLYDPISPASGLSQLLRNVPEAVVFTTTDAESGLNRIRHGSTASSLIQDSPVPVVVAPGSAFGVPTS